jgi:ATP-dependent protease ClpP protease subunit
METIPTEATIALTGRITRSDSEDLLARVEQRARQGFPRVELVMSTPGGEVQSALMLFERMRASQVELVTRATGEVASMGTVVFLAGDRRVASPEATFLLHPIKLELPRSGLEVDANSLCKMRDRVERNIASSPHRAAELDLAIARVESEEAAVRAIFEERTELTGGQIRSLVKREQPLNASDARAIGIVHELTPAAQTIR